MLPNHVIVLILILIPVFAFIVYRVGIHLALVFYHNVAMNKIMLETREVEETIDVQETGASQVFIPPPTNALPHPAPPPIPAPQQVQAPQLPHHPVNGLPATNGQLANAQPRNARQIYPPRPENGNVEDGNGNGSGNGQRANRHLANGARDEEVPPATDGHH
ncbi:hypothetical protein AJ78_07985 [Emergomyces pasteurianus Ep9510]|uniref:Uncharacterized protein n=1 Tax=Emergomyces pasteurianus Ep9510 TaxID=1447872 RepID=A0A1J9Q4L4_9EURO|nr:hypothetical protein AJ78_07985 [Emergomyces pasteurianus Ep9510]